MIHDILLTLLNSHSSRIPIEDLMNSEALSVFLHPCEKKILEEILKIIRQHRELATFTKIYGANLKSANLDVEDPLQKGLYLQMLAAGIDNVLESYLESITELERSYLQNPSHSLLFIFHKINIFQPLFSFLLKLVRDIKAQRLHGCSIVQYLHQNMLHGNAQINKAIKMIQSSVNVVFFKQLTHWLLYGKVIDTYGEFFIQCSEFRNTTFGSEKCTSAGSGRTIATTISDNASTYAEIWRYEICYEFLPHYLSTSWAEKVLFIGQTVLMFKVDANKNKKNAYIWNESEKHAIGGSLWNEKEDVFFKMIQQLQDDPSLNVSRYERVIDEIKAYVTERLSQIAVDQADLVKQLKLIKDFFLLGRGELFLEFIKKAHTISRSPVTENTVRDLVKAFDFAAHSVNLTEELEQFSFVIPKERIDNDDSGNFGYLQFIALQYKINWPLHLLFSPKVIERYNELFRFLMLIKRTQYDLHMVWCHHRENKTDKDVKIQQLRNQLMFLIDNLQCYILIDVLESQFSILMNTVLSSNDFEHIQKAHSIFQANILSQCFLLSEEEPSKTSVINPVENPVLSIFNKIFHLCDAFCNFVKTAHNPQNESKIEDNYNLLETELGIVMEKLLNMLISLKAGPSSTPLSQLLLRLDYNHWFSTRKEEKRL